MGLLDGVLGGVIGGEMVNVVNGIIERHGGLSAMTQQFEQQGAGNAIRSWISTGPNQPISPDRLHQAVGPELMSELAAKLGTTPQELSARLSTVMPQAVDQLTPNGAIPAAS